MVVHRNMEMIKDPSEEQVFLAKVRSKSLVTLSHCCQNKFETREAPNLILTNVVMYEESENLEPMQSTQ